MDPRNAGLNSADYARISVDIGCIVVVLQAAMALGLFDDEMLSWLECSGAPAGDHNLLDTIRVASASTRT